MAHSCTGLLAKVPWSSCNTAWLGARQHGTSQPELDLQLKTRLLAGPDHGAPAFRLAEEGYDVWLGNFRGNHESRLTIILVCIRHEGSIRFSIPTRRTSSGSFHKMRCQNMICHLNSTMCCSSPTKRRKEFVCGLADISEILIYRFSMWVTQWAPPPTWR